MRDFLLEAPRDSPGDGLDDEPADDGILEQPYPEPQQLAIVRRPPQGGAVAARTPDLLPNLSHGCLERAAQPLTTLAWPTCQPRSDQRPQAAGHHSRGEDGSFLDEVDHY